MTRLTLQERALASAYRRMLKAARRRSAEPKPVVPSRPFRGRRLDKDHKAAVSALCCLATYRRRGVLRFGVHVAHLRHSSASYGAVNPGLQRKPDDCWTLPLCPEEHRLQHSMGEAAYWAELKLDPHAIATALYDASPDPVAMTEVIKTLAAPLKNEERHD